jgi:hypothetical protein
LAGNVAATDAASAAAANLPPCMCFEEHCAAASACASFGAAPSSSSSSASVPFISRCGSRRRIWGASMQCHSRTRGVEYAAYGTLADSTFIALLALPARVCSPASHRLQPHRAQSHCPQADERRCRTRTQPVNARQGELSADRDCSAVRHQPTEATTQHKEQERTKHKETAQRKLEQGGTRVWERRTTTKQE